MIDQFSGFVTVTGLLMIVPSRKLVFSGDTGKAALAARLAADAKHLRMLRVTEPREIFLSASGKLAGKYAMTAVGANQYLTAVSRGLPQLVRFMMSEDGGHITAPDKLYPVLAKIVNQLLHHRGEAMAGCRAILCEQRKELDGFVGRSYCLVPNEEVNDQFGMACEMLRGGPQFYTAAINGRDITLVHIAKRQSIVVGNTVFKTGAVIQNSETAGRAIRSACVVIDSVSRTWSADRFYPDTRVMHVRGAKLRDRMMQSADNLSAYQLSVEDIEVAVATAMARPAIAERTTQAIDGFKLGFSRKAERMGVSATATEQVLAAIPLTTKPTPTLFDVYVRCLLVASASNVQRSLPLRQLAFSLVFDR